VRLALLAIGLVSCTDLAGLDDLRFGSDGGEAATQTAAASGGSAGSSASASTGGDGGMGGAGGRGPCFHDDFQRPDGPVGNGWTEKTPDVFSIVSGRLVKGPTTSDYRDNLVYRETPGGFDADVALTVDVTVGDAADGELPFPQLALRVFSPSLGPDVLDAYLLYVSGSSPDLLRIARQISNLGPETLASFEMSTPLEPLTSYRLHFSAQGLPVTLYGRIERLRGDGPELLAEGSFVHETGRRLGDVGISGDDEHHYAYDDFSACPP
jgi:hypothetical protein